MPWQILFLSDFNGGKVKGEIFKSWAVSGFVLGVLALRQLYRTVRDCSKQSGRLKQGVTAFKGIQGIPVIPTATRDFAKSLWWPGNTRNH